MANGGIGDGIDDRPPSEISVLDDSPPGDVVVLPFQPKKELILFPGVLGWRGSELTDMDRPSISICRGGGRLMDGCKAILVARLCARGLGGGEFKMGMKGSLSRRLCKEVPFVNWFSYSSSKKSAPSSSSSSSSSSTTDLKNEAVADVSIRRGLAAYDPRDDLGTRKGKRWVFQILGKRDSMYVPYHDTPNGQGFLSSAPKKRYGREGIQVGYGAYLYGFLGTDIKESPSEGDDDLGAGVGMEVGLSPSIVKGGEGCRPEVRLAFCGKCFPRAWIGGGE